MLWIFLARLVLQGAFQVEIKHYSAFIKTRHLRSIRLINDSWRSEIFRIALVFFRPVYKS